eukprot:SAG11_NODE_1540_length_4722_cov_2.812243_3_plen_1121_part_00
MQDAHALFTKKGIPVWMDISGGMGTDIYNSMAEGVQSATAIVCFMTFKYESSKNCALELKFAHQRGLPIVPAMMQEGFVASGWLGILTAGLLWTRLWNLSTFPEDIDSLVEQIVLTTDPEAESSDAVSSDANADEVKSELLRLREDATVPSASQSKSSEALVPPLVPALPVGVLVTSEMEDLLSRLIKSDKKRLGFCGMGGIGKTVISSWLVRQHSVRSAFENILWVTLGQTPDVSSLQRVLYDQLSPGDGWDLDAPDEIKTQKLRGAFIGKSVLLVLDDLWDNSAEEGLNFVDDGSASKVLLSSRVRSTLEGKGEQLSAEDGVEIVQIQLPSEDQAVQMLLSTAGITVKDHPIPNEAAELVRFCNMLPLAVSIAGKLVKDLELDSTADWDGIVSLLKDEFADGDSKTIEDTVIKSSLKSIRGSHKDNVISLFKCLALVPEDTVVPLEMLTFIFQAGCSTDEETVKRPKIIMIRRWLKVLIERSLILGTVDRISCHDIIREYTLQLYTQHELRQAHRRLVELLRQNRPQAPDLVPAWTLAGVIGQPDRSVAYVRDNIVNHIREATTSDWVTDRLAIDGWLSDCPQDIITHATAKVIGIEDLTQLVQAADDDQWTFGKRAILRGYLARTSGVGSQLGDWLRRGVDALGNIPTNSLTPEQDHLKEALELETFSTLSVRSAPEDVKYIERMRFLAEQDSLERLPVAKGLVYAYLSLVSAFGDVSCFGQEFVKFPKAVAHGARTHPDPRMRLTCKLLLCCAGMLQPSYSNADWNWDEIYLDSDGTTFTGHVCDFYTFETMHLFLLREQGCWGHDCIIDTPTAMWSTAYHYGQLSKSVKHYDMAMASMDAVLAQPNQHEEAQTIASYYSWMTFALDFNRPAPLHRVLENAGLTWQTGDDTFDQLRPHMSLPCCPRGEIVAGAPLTAEACGWNIKLAHVLTGADGVDPAEVCESLPTWEQHLSYVKAGLPFSMYDLAAGDLMSLNLSITLTYEKFGRVDEALGWAQRLATLDDPFSGGNMSVVCRSRGLCIQGRCLASKGQIAEAEAALVAAAEQFGAIGYFLAEVLVLRDLLVCVLKTTGKEREGEARLRAAVARLIGVDAPQEELDVLAVALGEAVDLPAILAG